MSAEELRKKHPKHMGTMAYPYMNGTLHAGHAFTMTKVEFATGWARMRGKRALFPQGYHCTGMPIKACADKLVDEVKRFGQNFENCPEEEVTNGETETIPAPTQETTKSDVTKFTAKKSKAAAKAVKLRYQFQIMLALGIPVEEVHKFANPAHWLEFFPPLCQRDLTNIGARVDWRRSMVTTDANPYYDAFVRWQMNRLKELGKIKFGKRYTVYSPKDRQACMDHDRQTGEGVAVQEYTALKLKVKQWAEPAQKLLSEKLPANANVYFVPATLRPETMYGQTCCFVGPKVEYGIFKVSDNEYYFISDRAARNMAYQGIFPEWGVFPKVANLQGSDVVGTLVDAPLSVHTEGVYIAYGVRQADQGYRCCHLCAFGQSRRLRDRVGSGQEGGVLRHQERVGSEGVVANHRYTFIWQLDRQVPGREYEDQLTERRKAACRSERSRLQGGLLQGHHVLR